MTMLIANIITQTAVLDGRWVSMFRGRRLPWRRRRQIQSERCYSPYDHNLFIYRRGNM